MGAVHLPPFIVDNALRQSEGNHLDSPIVFPQILEVLNALRQSMAQLQSNAVVHHQVSHCQGGIPFVDGST